MSNDINAGSLPALLPFFVNLYGMDYTAAAGLMFASSFLSSIIQPLFGWLADKGPRQWFMALGIFFTGTSLALTGFVTNYWLIFTAITIMGIASAIFHPEAARCVNGVSQGNRGEGMSIFSVGGNAGFGFGPLLSVFLVTTFGMHGLAFYGISAICMSFLFLLASPHLRWAIEESTIKAEKLASTDGSRIKNKRLEENDWSAFGRLFARLFFSGPLCIPDFPASFPSSASAPWVPVKPQGPSPSPLSVLPV